MFLCKSRPFLDGLGVQESRQEVTKVVCLVKIAEKSSRLDGLGVQESRQEVTKVV